jgi:AcrR family transcriptional regulator
MMTARERFLDAAAEVLRTRGFAAATTKEIASAAGLSEAMLYKVFRDKVDLFLGVLTERLPRVALVRDGVVEQVGHGELGANLEQLAVELLVFYSETFPIAASVFSDQRLLSDLRDTLRDRGRGPQVNVEAVTDYLTAEQQAGRVAATAQPAAAAELLVGACLHRAFLTRFNGGDLTARELSQFAADVVDTLRPSLEPDRPDTPPAKPAE